MRKMKFSGINWIGDIPEEWDVARLKDIKSEIPYSIVDGPFGTAISTSDYRDTGVPLLRIVNLNEQSLKTDNFVYITKEHADRLQRSKFYLGDIIFAKTGATVGKCAINSNVAEGVMSSSCVKISISDKYCSKFYYYWFNTIPFNEALRQSCNGTTRDTINLNPFSRLNCVIPPLSVQTRISTFLDQQCAQIDSAIEKTKASIEEYKKLKQSIITEAVTKGVRGDRPMKDSGIEWIGEIPEEWDVLRIKWLLNERNDRSESGSEEPLSMSQKYGLIPTKEMDTIPNMASSFVGAKKAYIGDLVFNKLKAHLGVFAVSKYDGLVSPDYAVYYSSGLANVKFLEYLFKIPQYISEFKKRSTGVGAGLTRLYTAGLFSIYCALPSKEEQLEIEEYINEKMESMNNLIGKKEQFITELESYKKSLIYEYVTGKKEVPQA